MDRHGEDAQPPENLRAENEALRISLQEATCALQRQRETAGRLGLMMRYCDVPLLGIDERQRVRLCTEAFLTRANLSWPQIAGEEHRSVLAHFASADWIEAFDRACEAAIESRDAALMSERFDLGRNGHPRDYDLVITPTWDEGGVSRGVLVGLHDITEKKRRIETLEEALLTKLDFLSAASYQFRTPLQAIIGLTDMLKASSPTGEQTDYIDGIHEASGMLVELLRNVMDYAQLDAGTLTLREEFFHLHELLDGLRGEFTARFAQTEVAFSMDLAPDLPDVVYGDERRLRRMLVHLLTNALKFTAEGSVRLACRPDLGDRLLFTVTDTGIGILPGQLQTLHEPLVPNMAQARQEKISLGLGLSIVHGLAALMGGSISVDSEHGRGTTVALRVPLPAGKADAIPETPPVYAFTAPAARVLVVDDAPINLMVATAVLETFGVQCDGAYSGAEALGLLRDRQYDLVFMDHMMPGMDGVETTQAIRTLPGIDHAVPVVALTANAAAGAREMFLASGFHDFMAKPVDRQAIAACLLKWLPPDTIVRDEST